MQLWLIITLIAFPLTNRAIAFQENDLIGSQFVATYFENRSCYDMITQYKKIQTRLSKDLESKLEDLKHCLNEIPHTKLPIVGTINLSFNADKEKNNCLKKHYDPFIDKQKIIHTDFTRALTVRKEIYDVINIQDKSKFIKGLPCFLTKKSFDRKNINPNMKDSDFIKNIIGNCVIRNENEINMTQYNQQDYTDRKACVQFIHDQDLQLKEQFKRGLENPPAESRKTIHHISEVDPEFCQRNKKRVFLNPNDRKLMYDCLLNEETVQLNSDSQINLKPQKKSNFGR